MRIAIVGFGIAGGSLAVQLARAGHDVTVFEQTVEPGPVGAGFLLQPSGQDVLARIGLLDEVRAQAWPIRTYRADKAPGVPLISLRYDRRDPAGHALGVARGALFTVLVSAAVRAGATIRTGRRVVDVREDRDGVTALDDEGRDLGTFDWLAATDGARSAIRECLNPGSMLRESPYGALWGLGQSAHDCDHELRQHTRGTRVLVGLLPVGPRTQTFFWGVRSDALAGLIAAGLPTLVDRVAQVMPEAAPVLASIGTFDRLAFGQYGHAPTPRVHTDRVILIGDAAHASAPHLGQGANLALLDARALATAFAETCDPATAFPRWRATRAWQNRRYLWMSRLLAPSFQSDLGWLGPLRDLALPVMGAIPPLRYLMERTLAGRG